MDTQGLNLGLGHPVKPEDRTAVTMRSKLARRSSGSTSNSTCSTRPHPASAPCPLNFTVVIVSGPGLVESVRHPIATVCSLYCNMGRLGFYCNLET